MPSLTLREYEERRVNVVLDDTQLAALEEARVSATPADSSRAAWILKPSSYVGSIHVGSLSVVIRPKIPVDRVMFLVAYALDPKHWRQYTQTLRPADDLVESIVPAFVLHTRQAVLRGLLQGYRREEDAQHTVRGRIRFDEQLNRRYGISMPLEVTYDEFTEDIEENRLLKAALHRLSRLPVRSGETRKQVNSLRTLFSTVELATYPLGPPGILYTRLNEHYRPAVELARLIIDRSSLELYHGEVAGASFLLDMNRVFEQFLFVALREDLRLSHDEWRKGSETLDEAGAIRLEPDLTWRSGGKIRFVGDAKYKRVDVSGFRHPDIYQMLAYCTATGLPAGLLVYAAGEAEPGAHRIKKVGKTIEVLTLDLEGTPEMILASVSHIADLVREQCSLGSLPI